MGLSDRTGINVPLELDRKGESAWPLGPALSGSEASLLMEFSVSLHPLPALIAV